MHTRSKRRNGPLSSLPLQRSHRPRRSSGRTVHFDLAPSSSSTASTSSPAIVTDVPPIPSLAVSTGPPSTSPFLHQQPISSATSFIPMQSSSSSYHMMTSPSPTSNGPTPTFNPDGSMALFPPQEPGMTSASNIFSGIPYVYPNNPQKVPSDLPSFSGTEKLDHRSSSHSIVQNWNTAFGNKLKSDGFNMHPDCTRIASIAGTALKGNASN